MRGNSLMDTTDKVILIAGMLFLLTLSRPIQAREKPGCFPDYRPGYKCMGFEKLP